MNNERAYRKILLVVDDDETEQNIQSKEMIAHVHRRERRTIFCFCFVFQN